jgi:hypothetical protein
MTWSHMFLPVDNGRILGTRISNKAQRRVIARRHAQRRPFPRRRLH